MPSAAAITGSGKFNFFHPTKSPLVLALVFLAVSLFMLHKVHFKE
jgi:hypothetical protein